MDWTFSLAGFAVGVIVGMTGIGGGSLMTPLLMLGFGIPPAVAVGTDLLYATGTKIAGVTVHGIARTIDWQVVGWLAAGSLPASLGVVLFLSGTQPSFNDALFKSTLGVMLILTALALLFRSRLQVWAARHGLDGLGAGKRRAATLIVGALIGAAVSLSSIGAGAIGVAALVFLYPALSAARIVGSDIAHAVPLALVAGLGHAALGNVDWSLLALLLIGSVPGAMLGSLLAARLPEPLLRHALVVLLVGTGGRLILR